MTPDILGALAGLAIGVAALIPLLQLAARIEAEDRSAEGSQRANILRIIGYADVLVFAAIGYYVGPQIFGP